MSRISCNTKLGDIKELSFDWNIEDLYRLLKIYGEVSSPALTIPRTGGAVYHLVLNHHEHKPKFAGFIDDNGEKLNTEDKLEFFRIDLVGKVDLRLAGKVHVMYGDTSLVRGSFGDPSKDKYHARTNGWQFLTVSENMLFDKDYQKFDGCYPAYQNTMMKIKLSLWTPGIPETLLTDLPAQVENLPNTELVQSMKKLLLDPKHSDVVLKCQNDEFSCHKNILGARSPVFCRMFDVDMEENTLGVVEITDIDSEVLKAMIEFIYTGEDVTEEVDDLANLVYAGDKYELNGLLDLCYRRFLNTNDESNLVEMLIIADRHDIQNIKEVAMKRIENKKATYLKDKDFIRQMEKHPKLLLELMCSLCSIDE